MSKKKNPGSICGHTECSWINCLSNLTWLNSNQMQPDFVLVTDNYYCEAQFAASTTNNKSHSRTTPIPAVTHWRARVLTSNGCERWYEEGSRWDKLGSCALPGFSFLSHDPAVSHGPLCLCAWSIGIVYVPNCLTYKLWDAIYSHNSKAARINVPSEGDISPFHK